MRVWAPLAETVAVHVADANQVLLWREGDGWVGAVSRLSRHWLLVDGGPRLADPTATEVQFGERHKRCVLDA